MTKLSVNVNAVAYLRNRRDVGWPDLLEVAEIIMQAGAHGLTVHPRPDERHIRRRDVYDLSAWLGTHYPEAEFNIEGYPTAEFLALVNDVKPQQVTLVPDDPSQSTSDHGWDLPSQTDRLRAVIAPLKDAGMRVSIFVDPDPQIAALAEATGADRIEIYTGPYGGAKTAQDAAAQRQRIVACSDATGLGINAGHDLTLENLGPLVKVVPAIAEVSIGHAITADALKMGFAAATRAYLEALGSH